MNFLSVLTTLMAMTSVSAFAPAFRPTGMARTTAESRMAASDELYIDMDRRNLMNLILVGSAAVTVGGLAVPYIAFFVPPGSGGGGGGVTAKDALGNDISVAAYLETHPAKDRSLAQGLKGDAT